MLSLKKINILSLRNRYIPALLIIFIFVTFGFINVKDIMNSIHKDGEIINISGRQRMLSQKLVLLAESYLNNQNEDTKNQLKNNMNMLLESHKFLMQEAYLKEMRNHSLIKTFDEDVKSYLVLFEKLLEEKDKKILPSLVISSQEILIKFDLAVSEYEKIHKKKLKDLEFKENIIYVLTIVVLILEGLLIFYPASRKIKNNTRYLQNAVHEKTKELQKSIDIISNYVIYSRTDLKGNITYASNAFCETSGYSREELIGKPHNIVRHPEMSANAFRTMWETIKDGDTWKGEVKNLKKDGGFYWVDANISPEYDSRGNLIGYAGVRINITPQKELEDLNKNLKEKIKEEVVKNREKDLQLYEQSKQVQMAELIKNIAHQWRQPLTFISTTASGMKLQRELNMLSDEDLRENLNNIISKTKYLLEIINRFSDFINDDNTITSFYVQNKIDETLEIISNSLEKNNILVVRDYAEELIRINNISTYLSQAVLNIITNARDMLLLRKINNPQIKVVIEQDDKNVLIKIEDNAGGIDEKIIDKIFEPYFTTKHQSQGTGMGLHHSYNLIVKELKGKLYVKNSQEGAIFYIELAK